MLYYHIVVLLYCDIFVLSNCSVIDMLLYILFIADWQKIGERRQRLRDLNNARENEGRIDYYYRVGQKLQLRKQKTYFSG